MLAPQNRTAAMTKLTQDRDQVYEVCTSRDCMRALDALETFADDHPEEVLAGIYLDRVVGFVLEPPADAWDGIIHFNKK
jgi:adenylate cyclase